MKGLAILLFIVFTVQAQKPEPCATPSEFETKLAQFIPEKNLSTLAKLSYDGDGQRTRVAEEINMADKRTFVDVISLYKEKTMYVIQIKVSPKITRTCTKHPLTEPFKESRVPADATFLNQVYVGTAAKPSAGLLVDVFTGKIKGKDDKYLVSVTHNLCIPVSQQVEMPRIGHVQLSFYDVVLGIEDPGRFVPPPECHEAELRPLHPMKAKRIPKGFLV